jgi:hypothetical protein
VNHVLSVFPEWGRTTAAIDSRGRVPDKSSQSLENRLKKSTADLMELERALMSGDTDPRVLRDFRDAVDYVRKAAWAVQEWQARQANQRDTSTVLPLLTHERVRRATQLCKTITAELQEQASTSEMHGMAELSQAIEALRALLAIHQKTL